MRPSSLPVVASVILCVLASTVAAEPITIGERIRIQSETMNEERTILVSTPADYDQSDRKYPVLYMTDGGQHLTHTRGTVDFLAGNGLMPQVIIVGVNNTDRTRDLTPTNAVIVTEEGIRREFPTSGGAGTFLDFFEKELFPYIESNYRTLPHRTFTGHSFGGLFALNAYFSRPEMFDAVLAVSPSLLWDDEFSLRQAKAFFDDRDSSNSILFVAMGNEEEGDPRPNRLDRLEEVFETTEAKDFQWEVRRLPDETHGSVVLRAHYWGLRKVFEPWGLPRSSDNGTFEGGVEELRAHYASLAKRLGFEVTPNENQINAIGYQRLGLEKPEQAIAIFRYNTELFPDSANVFDSLGEALEGQDRLAEAVSHYATAVANAEKNGDARLELFRANHDRAKAALAAAETDE